MSALAREATVGIVGAGTMGIGIAQVAAAAGHPVLLFDAVEGAAQRGKEKIANGLERLVAKRKLADRDRDGLLGRITVVEEQRAFEPAALVIEAIVEDLNAKRTLFASIEDIVSRDAILATNTSAISITAIAAPLKRPDRVVGMHFFNPAPVMKLIEVVSGLATRADVAETVVDTATGWDKVAVRTRSTPGFIVNRIARPFYGEALRLLEEMVADPATLDALMTECGGFRMGPFALMDLIGHDVNYAVTSTVFDAFYQEPRYRPSLVQSELVDAGWLGRKSGRGFYRYEGSDERPEPDEEPPAGPPPAGDEVILDGRPFEVDGVLVAQTDGRTAAERAAAGGQPVILYDLALDYRTASRVAVAISRDVPEALYRRVVGALQASGKKVTRIPDSPGLVVMRTIAMLANEAFEALLHGVAEAGAIDAAMLNGVNYPKGPLSWAREIGLARVLAVVEALADTYRDPRYRPSFALRRAVWETA